MWARRAHISCARLFQPNCCRHCVHPQLKVWLAVCRLTLVALWLWRGSAVPITRPPVRMFCDAPCHVQSLLVCHLAVLGPRAGARACDMQGPQHMTEQRTEQGPAQIAVLKLLLVCPVTLFPSTRALRSPAVQTVAASPGPTVVLAGQTLPPSLAGSLPYMA